MPSDFPVKRVAKFLIQAILRVGDFGNSQYGNRFVC